MDDFERALVEQPGADDSAIAIVIDAEQRPGSALVRLERFVNGDPAGAGAGCLVDLENSVRCGVLQPTVPSRDLLELQPQRFLPDNGLTAIPDAIVGPTRDEPIAVTSVDGVAESRDELTQRGVGRWSGPSPIAAAIGGVPASNLCGIVL